MSKRPFPSVAIMATALSALSPSAIGQKMYWTDPLGDKIQRANLDGSSVEDVRTGLPSPVGLALDLQAGKVYWTDVGAHLIQRANLDGSNVEILVTEQFKAWDVAVEPGLGLMCWTDSFANIRCADLDGADIQDILIDLSTLTSVAIDPQVGKIYWTESGFEKIRRANLDGSNIENLITEGFNGLVDLDLDLDQGKMYWLEAFEIWRADLDGTDIEKLVGGLDVPTGIALDPASGKMFWADLGTGKIQRADLDGSNIEDLVVGLASPFRIALDHTCPLFGDGNADGRVDLADIGRIQICFTGDVGPVEPFAYGPSCRCLDFDEDGDIDLLDYAEYQAAVLDR